MSAKFSSVSPVDGSVLWQGQATPEAEITLAIERAHEAGSHWRRTTMLERIEVVRNFGRLLEAGRLEITELISREVGKVQWDAEGEVGAAIAKINLSIRALQERRSDQTLGGGGKSSGPERRVRYHPIGVALVLGPFNFPLHLPGGQIIPALLAGNTVVFKPSDQATAVGLWMAQRWREAGLPPGVLETIVGGVDTAVSAIDSPLVDGVFLTGSRAAGRAIHRQLAGRPGVLLALELGGNNPILVTETIDPASVGSVVSFSSFISAGQRCTCARRAIFSGGDAAGPQIDALLEATKRLRIGLPGDDPVPHVGPLISPAAVDGLRRTYDQLVQFGCEPLIPFRVSSRSASLVHPAIVDATPLDGDRLGQIGELEWFGPLLVVQRLDSFESALKSAAATPYGLAASLIGGTKSQFERFVSDVGAGVANWNGPTTGAAGTLPFGGLSDSGNHRPAGYFAIDFCSDPVASLQHRQLSTSDPWGIVK